MLCVTRVARYDRRSNNVAENDRWTRICIWGQQMELISAVEKDMGRAASTESSSRHSSREIASNLPKECRDFTRSRNTKTYNTRGSGGRMIADIETIAKASQYCHFLYKKRG